MILDASDMCEVVYNMGVFLKHFAVLMLVKNQILMMSSFGDLVMPWRCQIDDS